ncbi:hypothetical protein GCM10027176_53210 [Actinoallomurus bryophytorum]
MQPEGAPGGRPVPRRVHQVLERGPPDEAAHPPGDEARGGTADAESAEQAELPEPTGQNVGHDAAQGACRRGQHGEPAVRGDQRLALRIAEELGAPGDHVRRARRHRGPQQPGGNAEHRDHESRRRSDPKLAGHPKLPPPPADDRSVAPDP